MRLPGGAPGETEKSAAKPPVASLEAAWKARESTPVGEVKVWGHAAALEEDRTARVSESAGAHSASLHDLTSR
jgi:hypothetical protein